MTFPALKKLALSFILLAICYTPLAVSPSFAQTTPSPTTNSVPNKMDTNPDVPHNMHTYTQNAFIEVMVAAQCALTGKDPTSPTAKCLGIDTKTGKLGYVEDSKGAIGMMTGLISMTFNIPVHTHQYFDHLAGNFGFAKKTYAADPCTPDLLKFHGQGFCGLQPIMSLWMAFRNIVYLLFTLVFLVVGFAIMLRFKIDPRTVMTIENQIPKMIVSLLLVTFSFSISGFIIDMMYTTIYLSANIISQADKKLADDLPSLTTITNATNPFTAANAIGGVGGDKLGFLSLVGPAAQTGGDFFQPVGETAIGRTIVGGIGFALGYTFGTKAANLVATALSLTGVGATIGVPVLMASIVANFSGGLLKDAIGATIGAAMAAGFFAFAPQILNAIGFLLTGLILAIAIMWSLFRLWLQLLQAYVFLLLDIIFSPFWIMAGVFPGSPLNFGAWLRDMAAYSSVFPVTIGLFLMGRVLINSFASANPETTFVPPMIANPSTTNGIGALVGLGLILLAPQVVNIMRDTFKASQFKYTPSILQAAAVGPGVVSSAWHSLSSPYSSLSAFIDPSKSHTPLGLLLQKMRFGEKVDNAVGHSGPTKSMPAMGTIGDDLVDMG